MTSFSAKFSSISRAHIVPSKLQSSAQQLKPLSIKMTRASATDKTRNSRRYWLLKTEPNEWSWTDQAANGGISNWDGVKNKQAQNNLKSMKLNDLCFFYHSGNKARCVVGVVEVVNEWYEVDGGVVVDVKEIGEMRRIVDLKEMKRDFGMKGFVLFRQPRLSVVEVSEEIWVRVCGMGDGYVGDGRVDEDVEVESKGDNFEVSDRNLESLVDE